jgi:Flp pilus assembly protein TadG
MISLFRKLRQDRRGNAIMIAAASLPLIIGAAGLATDTVQWTLWKRQLQRAVDSAAMAGVYTRMKTDTQTDVEHAVASDKALNLHTWMPLSQAANVELLSDVVDSTGSHVQTKPVRVTFRIQQSLPFSSMFMTAAPIITAVSTAASVPDGAQYCVIGLDPSAKANGITISGSTYLDLGSCSLIANSTNPTSAATNGTSSANGGAGSTVKAASLAAAGGVNYSKNWSVTKYNPYSSPVDDPFYSKKDLIPTTCDKTISISSTVDRTSGANADSASQTICMSGSQTIKGNVVLGPATYVINGGDLAMNSSTSSLSCNGCTIILTNFTNPANTGSVKLTGGTVNLSPPRQIATTGSDGNPKITDLGNQSWKGIALYQDPRATDDGKNAPQNKITGNSALSVQGVVYFGNQSLEFVGGGKDVAACLQVVSKRVTFSGNSTIKAASQCGSYGLNAIGGGRRVRLVG